MSHASLAKKFGVRYVLMGFAASFLSLLAFLGVCEVVLHLTNPMDVDGRMVVYHPDRLEMLAPNFEGKFHRIAVRTNEFGHRVPTTWVKRYTQEKPKGVFRILVYGDSITFGDEWPDEVSFVEKLQQRLDPSMKQVEVLNFGVPGYNPHQESNYIQETAAKFNPDLVILELTEVNDILEKPRQAAHMTGPSQNFKAWLRRHFYSYSVAADIWYNGRNSEVGKALRRIGKKKDAGENSDTLAQPPLPKQLAKYPKQIMDAATRHYGLQQAILTKQMQAWTDTRDSLQAISTSLAGRHIPFLLVMAPPSWDMPCSVWGCFSVPLRFQQVTAAGEPFYAGLKQALNPVTPYQVYLHEAFGPYQLKDLCDGRKGHYGPKKTTVIAEYLADYLGQSGLFTQAKISLPAQLSKR